MAASASAAPAATTRAPEPLPADYLFANAEPPRPSRSARVPLGATLDELVTFVMRAARWKGRVPDEGAIRAALTAPASDPSGEAPTAWGTLCPALGLGDNEALASLCHGRADWDVTLLLADWDGDGQQDYILMGTWTTAEHQNEVLGLFGVDGDKLRPLPRPDVPPLKADESRHHFEEWFVRPVPGGLEIIDTQIVAYLDAAGHQVSYHPAGENVATIVYEELTYLIDHGRPQRRGSRTIKR